MMPFSIITLGNFVSSNALNIAVKAYSNFYHNVTAKHQRRLTLHIIDKESYNIDSQAICKKLNIENSTIIYNLHQQEDIERTYKSGSVFLLPIKENRDALVKESLSYGLPFIGFSKYNYEEYIDQTCGMLLKESTDDDNILEFGHILQLLYFDPEARQFLKRGATNMYNAKFSWGSNRASRAGATY